MEIRKNTLGADNPSTALAFRSAGMANFFSDEASKASEMLSMYVRTVCLHVESRVNVEYVAVLILLSDIQAAMGKQELSKTTLSTAKEICEHDEGGVFQGKFPEFLQMIEERLATPIAPVSNDFPVSSDFQEQSLDEVNLEMKPSEIKVFRRIILSDD